MTVQLQNSFLEVRTLSDTKCVTPISFDDLPEIRPFPEIAQRIIAACNDAKTTASELCDLIQGDPSISLRVIQVANSSAYGLSGEVRTLRHAVVVLGFRTLRNLALSVAASDVFASAGDDKVARDALWEHSMAVACVANCLSDIANVNAEEAFLAGIVHDAGKLVFLDLASSEYFEATEHDNLKTIIAKERSLYGTDHQELGLRCADEWGLPFEISEAIGSHHQIIENRVDDPLIELIGVADVLARHWGIGSPVDEEDIEVLLTNTSFEIPMDDLDELEQQIRANFADLKACFGK